MRLLFLVFFCWHAVASVQTDGFYFPDQIPAKAEAQSQAWTDGAGNSQAIANAVASAGGTNPALNRPPPVEYPSRQPTHEPIGGHGAGGHQFGGGFNQFSPQEPTHIIPTDGGYGGHEFGGGFNQGYPTGPSNNPPYQTQPDPSFNGGGQSIAQANANAQSNTQGIGPSQSTSHSNAQASSQNFANGNTISNAISNTLTNGPNGEASASAAAAAAGVTFVNGIPVATASAAASVASTAPGAGAISSSSHAGGPQQNGPNFYNGPDYGRAPYYNGPYAGPNNGPYNGLNNMYNGPYSYQQPWFYRSAWDKLDDGANSTDTEVIEADTTLSESERIAKSSESDNVTVFKAPESKDGTVIFKD